MESTRESGLSNKDLDHPPIKELQIPCLMKMDQLLAMYPDLEIRIRPRNLGKIREPEYSAAKKVKASALTKQPYSSASSEPKCHGVFKKPTVPSKRVTIDIPDKPDQTKPPPNIDGPKTVSQPVPKKKKPIQSRATIKPSKNVPETSIPQLAPSAKLKIRLPRVSKLPGPSFDYILVTNTRGHRNDRSLTTEIVDPIEDVEESGKPGTSSSIQTVAKNKKDNWHLERSSKLSQIYLLAMLSKNLDNCDTAFVDRRVLYSCKELAQQIGCKSPAKPTDFCVPFALQLPISELGK